MRAARQFVETLSKAAGGLGTVESVKAELFGSLGHTGKGHGSDIAVLLGLEGERPEEVDCDGVPARISGITETGKLKLLGQHTVKFRPSEDIVFHKRQSLPRHPNGMRFTAVLAGQAEPFSRIYYSVGGGFVVNDDGTPTHGGGTKDSRIPYPFKTGAELLALCHQHGLSISTLMMENEKALRPEAQVRAGLLRIWEVMQACVKRGCEREGILPGGLKVKRRAAVIYRKLKGDMRGNADPLLPMDWVNLYALAVNEENAAQGRVVTAPTNGAAGIVPAVLHYYRRFVPNADDEGAIRFLLTAGAIGMLY
ncbi:MAG TPA: L-serine ammonia-lyase, partial [Archangium sp.]